MQREHEFQIESQQKHKEEEEKEKEIESSVLVLIGMEVIRYTEPFFSFGELCRYGEGEIWL